MACFPWAFLTVLSGFDALCTQHLGWHQVSIYIFNFFYQAFKSSTDENIVVFCLHDWNANNYHHYPGMVLTA
jgi:hypothetical protein